jgi:hypothetical protein
MEIHSLYNQQRHMGVFDTYTVYLWELFNHPVDTIFFNFKPDIDYLVESGLAVVCLYNFVGKFFFE